MSPVTPEPGSNWGIMGGAFNPLHFAHLRLAEMAAEAFELSGVFFVVTDKPPHREPPNTPFEKRFYMTGLGLEDNNAFVASDIETEIDGPGYTLRVVEALRKKHPKVNWHLVMGADNLTIFDSWYKPEEIVELAEVCVGARPGHMEQFEKSKWADKISEFEMPLMETSSTRIRELIKSGKSIRYLLPEKIRHYIINNKLYL